MICQTCKDGGLQNQRGLWFLDEGRKREGNASLKRAVDLHSDCRGCDCQHTVGVKTINGDYSVHVEGRPL